MVSLPSYPQGMDWSSQTSKVPISGQNMEYIDNVCAALSEKELITSGDIPTASSSYVGAVAYCASNSMAWCSVPVASNMFLYWTGSSVVWSTLPTYSGGWSTS